jgi:CheY-like chemotaxis protein
MLGATFEHLKALVIEDNAHMRILLRSLLNALGVKTVLEASNGTEGLRLLRDGKPDLVLTDLSMKPVDGIELTKDVRTSYTSPNPYVPIIMITGHTERHRVEAARDAGVTEFLAKPITAQALFLRLAEIVDRPRPFVRCETYFGPDRRRHVDETFIGPWRRQEDLANDVAVR